MTAGSDQKRQHINHLKEKLKNYMLAHRQDGEKEEDMNTVNLIGRLTADPRMATARNGKTYARYTLAVDRPGKDAGTDFIPCVAWGKSAEFAEQYLQKGIRIAVSGSIDAGIRQKKNGSKEMMVCVRVQRHSFADGKKTETHDSDLPYDQPEIDEDTPF